MPRIASVNPKGGTGKTTIAIHLAVAAHRDGRDTALVDADPQGSCLDWKRRQPEGYDGPAVRRIDSDTAVSSALRSMDTDMLVVDTPARLDSRTASILTASDVALVPVRPSALDLWGTAEFLDVLTSHVDRDLTGAFVPSQADVRTSLSDELEDALSVLDLPLFGGLTLRVSYARSLSEGRTVLDGSDATAADEVRTLYSDTMALL